MTKKDYVAIAKVLKDWDASPVLIRGMADMLANDNPRFDRSKFINACGGDS